MKFLLSLVLTCFISFHSQKLSAQSAKPVHSMAGTEKQLYIDIHHLPPGNVNYKDVANAHAKDLETQDKYGVEFLKFWVDEKNGLVYCLSSAGDSASIRKTHGEAHGLLPDEIYPVTGGKEAATKGGRDFFLDIHELGEGNVRSKDVEEAHKKDLEVEKKHGVNFINYWVNEKTGMVFCLSEAKNSRAIIETHREAHGLIPVKVLKVKQGQ